MSDTLRYQVAGGISEAEREAIYVSASWLLDSDDPSYSAKGFVMGECLYALLDRLVAVGTVQEVTVETATTAPQWRTRTE